MDPRFLRTFATVTRLASFSGAARELGYTQSAISQHIAALEAELGAPLLRRRPVETTEAGARLLEHAGPILLRLDAARADVRRVAAGPPGTLRLGTTPLSAGLAARAVATARAARPALDVTVRMGARDALAVAVATGELDAGFVDGVAAPGDPLRLPDTGLPVAESRESTLVVALPARHPLWRRTTAAPGESPEASAPAHPGVRLEDLADARWIDAPGVTVALDELAVLARAEGFRSALRYDGLDVGGLLALVAAGQGLALLPAGLASGVPLAAPALVHRTELLSGGDPPPPWLRIREHRAWG
jgi:DNA-binding transcriptional LysR family regulator